MTQIGNEKTTCGADERREAALRLFGALSGVEEDYLAACEEDTGRGGQIFSMARFGWKYGRATAAVLCLAVLGASYLSFRGGVFPGGMKDDPAGIAGSRIQYAADTSMPAEAYDTAASVTEATESESVAGDLTEDGGTEGIDEQRAGKCADTDLASGEESGENLQELQKQLTEESEENLQNIQAEAAEDEAGINSAIGFEKVTLAEAAELAVVGEYLPVSWPAEGHLESVRGSGAAGAESVGLTWTYADGWDSFFLTVTNQGTELPEQVQEAVADVSKPETYDENLYEIPYADSVPAKYHTVFQDPVFKAEDFTRECVEARIVSHAGDAGDTDTPRGNFRVLYLTDEGDYVLVDFNGRGSVEEVWNLMYSIGQ